VTFLHPLALLGLAAAAIPLLLHLFQRRTPPELDFPAVRYLADAERRSARRLRLRHMMLLALRTALIAVIVAAAARPLVPLAGAGGTHAPTSLVVILDNSVSSGATGGGRRVLDRLRAVARGSLAGAGPDDRAYLLLADGVVRGGTPAELLAIVDSTEPAADRLDVVAALERAVRLVQAEPRSEREIHVVSDLQASAIAVGRLTPPAEVRVLVLEPAATMPNRGVAGADVRDGAVAVTVGGTPGTAAGPVALTVGERDVARALAAPGQTVVLSLPAPGPGWWTGAVRVSPPDELRADDAQPVAWRVAPPPAVASSPDAGPFVATALGVLREAGRVTAGGAVRVGGDPGPGVVVLPPADRTLLGAVNRALAARAVGWAFGPEGTPGLVADDTELGAAGVAVRRRQRLVGTGGDVLARVNGEPWLVRAGGLLLLGSRLDTAWTALPTSPAFVPFLERVVRLAARGERAVQAVPGAPAVRFDVRGRDTIGATVSALDPRESDLTAADPVAVRRALGTAPLGERAFGAARFGGARRADASTALLLLALLLAMAEVLVAWRTR